MADQAIINLFHGLGQEIGGLSSVIKTQGVFQDISPILWRSEILQVVDQKY